ncbi:BMP-binding endothelial regulator protein-like protein [Aphelenchoides fujianensis]|nr:BMP-binding endothelial regulator protein-like protein [Aphelenchoides fujianensis]
MKASLFFVLLLFLVLPNVCAAWPQWLSVAKICGKENETFKFCGPRCAETCDSLQHESHLPKLEKKNESLWCRVCSPGCHCADGFVLDLKAKGGRCVARTLCKL